MGIVPAVIKSDRTEAIDADVLSGPLSPTSRLKALPRAPTAVK